MSETVASWILRVAGIYLVLGLLFAIPFIMMRLKRSDPAADGSTPGFRLIIFPGVVLLWPVLAKRWAAGINIPPEEKSPHRSAN